MEIIEILRTRYQYDDRYFKFTDEGINGHGLKLEINRAIKDCVMKLADQNARSYWGKDVIEV